MNGEEGKRWIGIHCGIRFGLQWYQALNLAKKTVENRTLIGFDVVELAPREDSVLSDFITAQLTYALMDLV